MFSSPLRILAACWINPLLAAFAAGPPVGSSADRGQPAPATVLHVSPAGDDSNDGSAGKPFATLEKARDAIRSLRDKPLPPDGVAVHVHGGTYRPSRSLSLTAADSGEPGAPVVYQAAPGEKPVFLGGGRLVAWKPVSDPALLARLPEEARGKVLQASLAEAGIREIPPLRLGGFGSGRGFTSTPSVALYQDGSELPLARWPNEGSLTVENTMVDDGHRIHNIAGSKTGRFTCATDRLARWTADPDIILLGYWFWDWAESRELVKSIDVNRRQIELEPPFHTYGYRKGQPFHALNLFSEIDQPGEWYLDRRNGIVFLLPAGGATTPECEISTNPFPMVTVDQATHLRFEGLGWDLTASDGIRVSNCRHVTIAGCSLTRLGGDAIVIRGGSDCGVQSCDISTTGRGGILVHGGNRKDLTPARHSVENCHIRDLSRVDRTYTPAILVDGVGCRIAHNRIHDIPSSAIRLGGNDHIVEFNDVSRVVLESDDQGGVDMWGDPTYRGNVFRYNRWQDIGPSTDPKATPKLGRAAIRFDDAISGQRVERNIFLRCGSGKVGFGAIQIHGGKDNRIEHNLFVDCPAVCSFSAWQEQRWRDFIRPKFPSDQLDQALYLARYPDLAMLAESANSNELRANVAIGCGKFLSRNPPNTREQANVIDPTAPPSPADPVRPEDLSRAGIDPAKAATIGLYQDRWHPQPRR